MGTSESGLKGKSEEISLLIEQIDKKYGMQERKDATI